MIGFQSSSPPSLLNPNPLICFLRDSRHRQTCQSYSLLFVLTLPPHPFLKLTMKGSHPSPSFPLKWIISSLAKGGLSSSSSSSYRSHPLSTIFLISLRAFLISSLVGRLPRPVSPQLCTYPIAVNKSIQINWGLRAIVGLSIFISGTVDLINKEGYAMVKQNQAKAFISSCFCQNMNLQSYEEVNSLFRYLW